MGARELTLEQAVALELVERQHRETEEAMVAARRARGEAVRRALDVGVPLAQIARSCGVERPTVYAWKRGV